eukprot:1154576-Pelagomonas_calceolata.AAC.1
MLAGHPSSPVPWAEADACASAAAKLPLPEVGDSSAMRAGDSMPLHETFLDNRHANQEELLQRGDLPSATA